MPFHTGKWLAEPKLMRADKDAEYAAVYEIDLATINEPILCCPNDPDDAKPLSQVAGAKIDEVFIGSCMTNMGTYLPPASCWTRWKAARSPPACGWRRPPAWTSTN